MEAKRSKRTPAAQALTASPGEEIMEATCAKAGSRAVLTVSRCFKHHHISSLFQDLQRILSCVMRFVHIRARCAKQFTVLHGHICQVKAATVPPIRVQLLCPQKQDDCG